MRTSAICITAISSCLRAGPPVSGSNGFQVEQLRDVVQAKVGRLVDVDLPVGVPASFTGAELPLPSTPAPGP